MIHACKSLFCTDIPEIFGHVVLASLVVSYMYITFQPIIVDIFSRTVSPSISPTCTFCAVNGTLGYLLMGHTYNDEMMPENFSYVHNCWCLKF